MIRLDFKKSCEVNTRKMSLWMPENLKEGFAVFRKVLRRDPDGLILVEQGRFLRMKHAMGAG